MKNSQAAPDLTITYPKHNTSQDDTMSKTTQNNSRLPLILITALCSIALTLSVAWFTGFPGGAGSRQGTDLAHDHGTAEKEDTLYTCSMHPFIVVEEPGSCPVCGMDLVPKEKESASSEKKERQVAYWRAPMNPDEIYDKPGKSAMGMDLVPVYEDELVGGVAITIDPVTRQNMGLRTTLATTGPLVHTIRTYGHITYDETRTTQISPRYSGWVEKLHVNFTGQIVKKGEPLFSVYSPELVTAQEEYLEAYRNTRNKTSGYDLKILNSVRRRLKNFNVSDREIRAIETRNKPENTITIRSPFTGVVTAKSVVEGGFFKAGTNIYTLSDLSKIWVEAHVYEYELSRLKEGMPAEITLPYQPGSVYKGKVTYIYPYMQRETRDVVVRLEFDNPGLKLKPDMFANVKIRTTGANEGTVIPSEAVLRSGEQNIVFVSTGQGTFTPRNVEPGISLDGGNIHIISGIAPGEPVVTSGQFLLDSESKLKEAVNKMLEADTPEETPETPADESDDFFDDM